MRSCDSCVWFARRFDFDDGRIGICEYEDGSLARVITQCNNYKPKKYERKKFKYEEKED